MLRWRLAPCEAALAAVSRNFPLTRTTMFQRKEKQFAQHGTLDHVRVHGPRAHLRVRACNSSPQSCLVSVVSIRMLPKLTDG